MTLLTVVGKKLAKDGVTFTYMGPISNCRECKVKTICFHLEKGKRYKVTGVRGVVHDCSVHEEGVVVVEIEEVSHDTVIQKRLGIEGASITLELPRCDQRGCPHYRLCFPMGIDNGQKKKVKRVKEKMECAMGHERVKVELE